MEKIISPKELEAKVRNFIGHKPSSLQCYADFHFEDSLVRFPIETQDQNVFEATFCYGYGEIKYLAAISAQIGCAARCQFCELGEEKFKRNLTEEEIVDQLRIVLAGAFKRGYSIFDRPIKATFVMGGEPLANPNLPRAVYLLGEEAPLQLKISSLLPASPLVRATYSGLVEAAKDYPNTIQFQVSLNSTDFNYRQSMASVPLADFEEIRRMGEIWNSTVPNPRKVDLTFTVNKDTPMDPESIIQILPPELFAIRLREWVPTKRGNRYGLKRTTNAQMESIRKQFEDSGYKIIPGSPGKLEWRFKLAPGETETLKCYKQMKN